MTFLRRMAAILCVLVIGCSSALAASKKKKEEPAPPMVPVEILEEIPQEIQTLLEVARGELEAANGAELKKRNQYTDWNGSHTGYGWCGGFITWCALETGIPMEQKNKIKKGEVSGVVHVKEAGVGKLVTGYTKMNRISSLPQKGFIVVFGNSNSKNKKFGGLTPNYHVGLVEDVRLLENGKYRITTIEGNVSLDYTDEAGVRHKATHTIRRYIRDYDPAAEKLNLDLTLVPEEERDQPESLIFSYDYTYGNDKMYISKFLMTWLPSEYMADTAEEGN